MCMERHALTPPHLHMLLQEGCSQQDTAALHARHASIDMGLLNRQLHGGNIAASSLHPSREPLYNSKHWRGNYGRAVLPPGWQEPLDGRDGNGEVAMPPARMQHTEIAEEPNSTANAQRPCSPCASSDGGGSSFVSGELAGSPTKRLPAGRLGDECRHVLKVALPCPANLHQTVAMGD